MKIQIVNDDGEVLFDSRLDVEDMQRKVASFLSMSGALSNWKDNSSSEQALVNAFVQCPNFPAVVEEA